MCNVLNRPGFVYKKPKHVPGKADPEKQKEFVAEYQKLRENASPNEVFYFGDGCHPRHNSVPAFGWIRRGRERALKSNCSRQHVNINGFINMDTHTTCVDFPETVNAETTRKLFQKLISKHDYPCFCGQRAVLPRQIVEGIFIKDKRTHSFFSTILTESESNRTIVAIFQEKSAL